MADDGDKQDEAAYAGESERIASLEQIEQRLDALAKRVEEFFTAGGRSGSRDGPSQPARENQPPAPAGTGWQSQAQQAESQRGAIRDELAALKQQEEADKLAAATQDRIAKLEQITEKPPRELRRVEQFFGWGDS